MSVDDRRPTIYDFSSIGNQDVKEIIKDKAFGKHTDVRFFYVFYHCNQDMQFCFGHTAELVTRFSDYLKVLPNMNLLAVVKYQLATAKEETRMGSSKSFFEKKVMNEFGVEIERITVADRYTEIATVMRLKKTIEKAAEELTQQYVLQEHADAIGRYVRPF